MSGSLYAGAHGGFGHNGGPAMFQDQQALLDAEQRVWSFFINQAAYLERETFEIRYPDIRYPELVPVDTSAPEWTQTVVYFSGDKIGQAEWFHAGAHDVPMVERTRNQFQTTVQMAAIGYGYNTEELVNYALLGRNLTTDKSADARRAAEEFIDRVALFGDVQMGYLGLLNQTSVTNGSAAGVGSLNGATNSPLWANKTPDQILADVNGVITGIWTGSNTVEMADTVLLPLTQFVDVSTRMLTELSTMTVLDWMATKNAYTAETGRPLTIRGLRGLHNAGSGATARMVAYRRDPSVVKFHMPMPFRFLPPWRTGPMRFDVPGIFRLGGVDVKRPSAFRYLDGI